MIIQLMLKEKIMISSLMFMLFACGDKEEDTSVEEEVAEETAAEEVEEEDTASEGSEGENGETEEEPEDTSQEE